MRKIERQSQSCSTIDSLFDILKDQRGYSYEYDYENRIVKITKPGQTVVEYAYDALSRRIEKKVGTSKTRYYNNKDWQVLAEADANGIKLEEIQV
jgi:YD repeat-containing protein